MALLAAKLLQRRRTSFRGNVKIMFQPAEEGPGGAGPMIDEGLLKGPRVDAAFAIHMWNDLPTGRVGVRSGPVFASSDEFRMKIIGRGGSRRRAASDRRPGHRGGPGHHRLPEHRQPEGRPDRSAVVTFGQIPRRHAP